MTALAGLLLQAGCQVTGSDNGIYPPMSNILEEMGIQVAQGYTPETLPADCDLVVVGNVVSCDFPVLTRLKELGKHYLSLPQVLGQIFMDRTHNLVVAGCHGKTTTTAMAAKIWSQAKPDTSFLIGGATLDFPRPWHLATGKDNWFIIEGDEYDSAFFNKVPKFMHYRPRTVILTSVEFDHADIYPNFEAVKEAYRGLMKLIPSSPSPSGVQGRLVAWGDDPVVRQIAESCSAPVEFYGEGEDNDWRLSGFQEHGLKSVFELSGPDGFYARVSLPRPGLYNALNAAAAAAAFIGEGGDPRQATEALANFKGVKRRQEVIGTFNDIVLVDDFAHHPTAVEQTLAALKKSFPGRRLLAAFEPRSNTSCRGIFQNRYREALAGADHIFLRRPQIRPDKAPADDRLDADLLAQELGARAYDNGLDLGKDILKLAIPGDVVVLMSNGSFDGLGDFLKTNLQ